MIEFLYDNSNRWFIFWKKYFFRVLLLSDSGFLTPEGQDVLILRGVLFLNKEITSNKAILAFNLSIFLSFSESETLSFKSSS